MEELFEKVYNLYIKLLSGLEVGYEMNPSDLSEIWYLINIMYFLKFGHPTEIELLLISDRYETVSAFLDELDISSWEYE